MPKRRHAAHGVALLALPVFAFSTLHATAARAQTKDPGGLKLACVQASDKAQQLRVAGKLIAARDALRSCVLDACPNVVREACSQWLGEVNESIPSIVIGAKDDAGKDLLDLKVSIDGKLVTEHLDGRALPIDPGRHTMRYEKADGAVIEEEILVGQGAKNRNVSVSFAGAKSASPAAPTGSVTTTVPIVAPPAGHKTASTRNTVVGTVVGVVGAAALGTALYLDLHATSDVNDLRGMSCASTGTCSSSRVSSDRLDYDFAAVGLGIGIAAVGVATFIFLGHPLGGTSPELVADGVGTGFPRLQVIPTPHGSGLALQF